MSVALKGMTWSHPRGYDPMVACSRIWQEQTGVAVTWERRSLQDFETYPVEELANAYDLIVIDHPHVGQITREGCLAPLDVPGYEAAMQDLRRASVGGSFASYQWQGRQWAFPVDAATQVQAIRPDILPEAPVRWEEVIALAHRGMVAIPLRPPHSLMTFYTLAANLGHPCRSDGGGPLVDEAAGAKVIEMIRELVDLVDAACFDLDPITLLERMSTEGSGVACAPLIYGYANYSIKGFRPGRICFTDIPAAGGLGPVGSALGGTGIAVSAFSRAVPEATAFAYWIAGEAIQKGPYAAAGGQPGHAAAWEDDRVNAATMDFYRGTRATLEAAWIRPRHDGYMAFQQKASDLINDGLKTRAEAAGIVANLNRLFLASLPVTGS